MKDQEWSLEELINWIFLWRLPIQNHLKESIIEKGKNKVKYLTWNSIRLCLWRRPACQTLSKALDISSATARVVPCAVDQEDLYWKSEKRPHFPIWSKILLFTSFSRIFINLRKKTNRAVGVPPIFLNTGATNETFQQTGKQDSFRHILKSSAGMYESSDSKFFRTTTGIESGPDASNESKFVMTF